MFTLESKSDIVDVCVKVKGKVPLPYILRGTVEQSGSQVIWIQIVA